MTTEDENGADARFQQLYEAMSVANSQCHCHTCYRLAREGMRLAKRERNLGAYLYYSEALYTNTDHKDCDMAEINDVIIESIALMEDPNKAREFEPGLEEEMFERFRWSNLPLAYHKLATVAGHQYGDNSPGLHQCIQDGIAVCKYLGSSRTSLLLFREFGVEVQKSSDDLEMGLHTARESIVLHADSSRKVASTDDVVSILALLGRLKEACDVLMEGFGYCQEFHNPYLAMLNYVPMAREVAALAGREDLLKLLPVPIGADEESDLPESEILRVPSFEENTFFEFNRQKSKATELACAGDYAAAIKIIQFWDKLSYDQKNIARWFVIRCRYVALERLNGNMEQAIALAKPAEVLAKRAHDWLTLRKLRRLLDPNVRVNPFATVEDPDCGPFSSNTSEHMEKVANTTDESAMAAGAANHNEQSPDAQNEGSQQEAEVPPYIEAMYAELDACEGEETILNSVAKKAMSTSVASIASPLEAEQLLQLAGLSAEPESLDVVIQFGQELLQRFPKSADVLSMVAGTWARMKFLVDDAPVSLSDESLERMFQRAMDLDIESAKAFFRAGSYYFGRENLTEAERFLARAFRLNRQHGTAARTLAKIYN